LLEKGNDSLKGIRYEWFLLDLSNFFFPLIKGEYTHRTLDIKRLNR